MKKFIYVALLTGITYVSLADAKKELQSIIKNDVSSKEFQQKNESIDLLTEKGKVLASEKKYDQAMECYKEALKTADKLFGEDSTAAAMVYISMGSLFLKKGDRLKAADLFVKSSDIFKKSIGGLLKPQAGKLLLLKAGFIYFEAQNFEMAYQTLEKAKNDLKYLSAEEKEKYFDKYYRYLALAFYNERKYIQAVFFLKYSQNLEMAKKTVNSEELAVINLFLGISYLEIDKVNKALEALNKSKGYFKTCKTTLNYQFELYFALSNAYELLNDKKNYLLYAKELNEICKKFSAKNFRKIIGLVCLADATYANNQKNKAVMLMKQAVELAKNQNQSTNSIKRIQLHLQELIKKK